MIRQIGIGEVEELLRDGAQLVEVLPRQEYEQLHLPGAVNIPLQELDARTASGLDPEKQAITYCWDSL